MKHLLAAALVLSGACSAHAADPQRIRIVVGTSTINVAYPAVTLPESLGYWREEGLSVELLPSGGSLQAIQQLVGGGADFAELNASAVLQGVAQSDLPLAVLATHGIVDWRFVVPEGSDITGAADLSGRKLGMLSLSTGGMPLLKSYLAGSGVDPDSVEVVPVGMGAAPVEALRRGDVDALLYWNAAVSGFANAGLVFDTFAPEEWSQYPDYSLATTGALVEADPDLAVKVARAMAKAALFARTSPECALKLFWRDYPDVRSQGPDEATSLAWDLNLLTAQTNTYAAAAALSGPGLSGMVPPENWSKLQAYMIGADLIEAEIPAEAFLPQVPQFHEKINDFDQEAVIAQARACAI